VTTASVRAPLAVVAISASSLVPLASAGLASASPTVRWSPAASSIVASVSKVA
jgi:hypothetical protein